MKYTSSLPNYTKLSWRKRLTSAAFEFAILFAFWLVLSGHYEAKYILLGVLSAGLVTFLTNDLFYFLCHHGSQKENNNRFVFLQLWRFLAYIPWLLYKIMKANIQIAYLVLHPRMPIKPALLQFRTHLRRSISQVIVANSITLMPGTLTVSLEDGGYIIHVLVPPSASEILKAQIQNKVGAIFMEEKEKPPARLWAYSLEELKE